MKEEQERSKQERDQLAVFLQLKNDVFEKNQLYKTAKKELDNDPDDEDKHEAENISAQQSAFYAKNMRR